METWILTANSFAALMQVHERIALLTIHIAAMK